MENKKIVEWLLRIGVAGEFFGHGLLAIGEKPDWIHWISQLTGLSLGAAGTTLFLVGVWDIIVALIVLLMPIPIILLWASFWGFWTALVRPLVGLGWLDFIERSANFAAPLALLYLLGFPRSLKQLFTRLT